jgi:hypothetical protein
MEDQNNNLKCPRCKQNQCRIEFGTDSFYKDVVCYNCQFKCQLRSYAFKLKESNKK